MKQYTDESQTAKLIELGFKKPESIIDAWAHETDIDIEYVYEYSYSIGELIAILPEIHPSYHDPYCLDIGFDTISWIVGYYYNSGYVEVISSCELIDALYDMIIMLKEEGII